MSKLSPKQEKFCQEYLVDLNATRALIRAGYSKNGASVTASRLLAKAKIQEKIAKLRKKIEAKTDITVEKTVRFIKEVAEEARDEGDHSNALKGADLLMKHLGGYEKDNLQSKTSITIKPLDSFYDDEA